MVDRGDERLGLHGYDLLGVPVGSDATDLRQVLEPGDLVAERVVYVLAELVQGVVDAYQMVGEVVAQNRGQGGEGPSGTAVSQHDLVEGLVEIVGLSVRIGNGHGGVLFEVIEPESVVLHGHEPGEELLEVLLVVEADLPGEEARGDVLEGREVPDVAGEDESDGVDVPVLVGLELVVSLPVVEHGLDDALRLGFRAFES